MRHTPKATTKPHFIYDLSFKSARFPTRIPKQVEKELLIKVKNIWLSCMQILQILTYRDTTLPKSLSIRVYAKLCYINSATYLLFLYVRLLLTCVLTTISLSRMSHYLSLGFKTSFLGSQISPTSSPLLMSFLSFSCALSMSLPYAIHEHVSSLHSYSWEPHTPIIHGNLSLN